MAQKKKKKSAQNKPNPGNYPKEIDRVMLSAIRDAQSSGSYMRKLGLKDEGRIRIAESGLHSVEKMALSVFVFGNFRPTNRFFKRESSILHRMLAEKPHGVQRVLKINTCLLLSNYLPTPKQEEGEQLEIDDLRDMLYDILPEKYVNFDVSDYNYETYYNTFTNIPISVLCSVLDWDAIFSGNDIIRWARRINELIRILVDADVLESMDELRGDYFCDLIDKYIKHCPPVLMENADGVREDGLETSYYGSSVFPSWRSFSNTHVDMPNGSSRAEFLSLPRFPLKEDDSHVAFIDRGVAYLSTLQICNLVDSKQITNSLEHKYSIPIITYSLVWLLANCSSADEINPLTNMAYVYLLSCNCGSQPFNETSLGYLLKDETLCINPYQLREIPDKELTLLHSKIAEEWPGTEKEFRSVHDRINVAQIAYIDNEAIMAPELHIDMSARSLLIKLGYTNKEAYAICGYISGIQSLSPTAEYMFLNMDDTEFSESRSRKKEIQNLDEILHNAREEERKKTRAAVESELQSSMNEVKRMREQTEADRRRLMKEHRDRSYRASKAIEKAEEQLGEVDALRHELNEAAAERQRLEEVILALSEQIPDTVEEQEDISDILEHADIGKDIKFNIFGGAVNWIAEQRGRFPYISFYDAETLPNEAAVANSDILMLNTFVMNHKYFWILQRVAKQNGIQIVYFKNKGINSGSRQIYEAYQEYMASKSSE